MTTKRDELRERICDLTTRVVQICLSHTKGDISTDMALKLYEDTDRYIIAAIDSYVSEVKQDTDDEIDSVILVRSKLAALNKRAGLTVKSPSPYSRDNDGTEEIEQY